MAHLKNNWDFLERHQEIIVEQKPHHEMGFGLESKLVSVQEW